MRSNRCVIVCLRRSSSVWCTPFSITVGIEALITLVDLAQLSREGAVEVMRWSALALLRAALKEGEAQESG